MKILLTIAAAGLMVLALGGCSDKQKEAEKLEQEMRALQGGVDSAVADSVAGEEALSSGEGVGDAAAIPEEAEIEQEAMPPAPAGGGYTVQVAACESEEYARTLVDIYGRRGYEPFVSTITFEGQTYHRVRVGNFETLTEAGQLKSELSDKYSIQPWIDRLSN